MTLFIKVTTLTKAKRFLYTLWLFTESDFPTFVLPNTAFGIFGALSGSRLTTQDDIRILEVSKRLPHVILFNWSNVFVFELANQRHPESVEEDLVNKPWRPIPTARISQKQTRRLMLISIFVVLALNFVLGVWKETALLFILTWLYNDLQGGDEVFRDLIIAVAFSLYNHGSLSLATLVDTDIEKQGYTWIGIISFIILMTMQIQDLKDQAGDRKRGRRTVPLVFGDEFSRLTISTCVIGWSFCCVYLWDLKPLAYVLTLVPGALVAIRTMQYQSPDQDSRTWKLWCVWTATLYVLPLVSRIFGSV